MTTRSRMVFILAVPVVVISATPLLAQKLEIHHINVGQGDATLIVGPDRTAVLIDGGNDGLGSQVVIPYLRNRGISRLKYVIATHMHADHIGGLDEVLCSGITVDKVFDNGSSSSSQVYKDYSNAAASYAGSRSMISPGKRIRLGAEATALCVYANGSSVGGTIAVSDENDRSVCFVVEYAGFSYFIGGDLGGGGSYKDVESFIAPAVGDIDVLRVNHHGSASSTNHTFVGTLKPEAAIISVGANSYGHPSSTAINNLYSRGADVLQTGAGANPCGKVLGHIVVVVKNKKNYWINGSIRKKDEYIKAGNRPPTADFSYSENGLTVAFDAARSSDDGKIRHYYWNYGDGVYAQGNKLSVTSHTYKSEGTYKVLLSVVDNFGLSGSVSESLFVGRQKSITASASAEPANPNRYSWVKIHVSVRDQDGKPVSGASVKTVAHYKTTDTTKYGTTDGAGYCWIDYYISSATSGYTVWVDVTAGYAGMTAWARTSFTPK